MVRKFPTFRSERKKRTTSGGSPQFPNGFSGKLLFHLTFWLNGKHPLMQLTIFSFKVMPIVGRKFKNVLIAHFISISVSTTYTF